MAWYSVDERLLTIRLAPKIAQPVTCQPSPRRAACTTITTRAATESAEAMPEVMLFGDLLAQRVSATDDGACLGCRHRAIMSDGSHPVVRGAGDRVLA